MIHTYLEELAKQLSIENQDLDMVLRAQLSLQGMPITLDGKKAMLDEAVELAGMLSSFKLKKLHNGVKGICKLLNIHEAPDEIVWGARRAGVELFESTPAEPTREAN